MEEEIVNKPKKKRIWRLKHIHEVNEENDIKFRGPLSYRHLRAIGWLFFALGQIGIILGLATKIKGNVDFSGAASALQAFSSLMAPLFLVAAFSQVLIAKNGYKKLIITYAVGSVAVFLATLFVYEHYIVALVAAFQPEGADDFAQMIITLINKNSFMAFNVFIDLLLFTLLTFFLLYRPKKHFQGKKIYIFRCLAILPLLYEAGSIFLKVFASAEIIVLHPLVFPILTTKPPMAFLMFVVMVLFIKFRERYYIKKGKTHEEYQKFLNTNVNRLHFSIALSIFILVFALIDMFTTFGIVVSQIDLSYPEETIPLQIIYYLNIALSWGFGKVIPMVLVIPILILFNYRKTYKNKNIDLIIPIAGFGLVALIYLEGVFQVVRVALKILMS